MMYKAIIIEDEKPAQVIIRSYLELYFKEAIQCMEVIENVNHAKSYLRENDADIIFLDVQLRGSLGIDLLDEIDITKHSIIFTTAYDDYAIEAFKAKAFGYLLKPIGPIDFKEIVNRTLNNLKAANKKKLKKIKVPNSGGFGYVELDEIVRCESSSNYTKIICVNDNEYLMSKTLKIIEESIINSNDFIRVHHSHLVNLKYVDDKSLKANSIQLTNGDVVPISRSKKEGLFQRIIGT